MMDFKIGKVQRKRQLNSRRRFWFVVAVIFTLIMLLIATILTLTVFSTILGDKTCDNFIKEGPYCLNNGKNDIKRVYSTRTTFDQSVKIFSKLADPIDISPECEPVMLYLFSRHSIRYPKADDIIEMGELLPQLQSELRKGYESGQSELCEQDYEAINSWKLQMIPENDNHVTPSGIEATKNVSKFLYSRYPSLFDPSKVNFEVGVTSKVRTNETAHAFVEGLLDLQPDINITENGYVLRDYLQFHTICKKKIGVKLPKPKKVREITNSVLFKKLRERVSKRMGLNRTITDDELDVMYTSCGFEKAIYEKSPWCALFTKKELKVLESREDIEHYYKNGPGFELNRKMPCPLISHLHQSVEKAIAHPENRTTYLYFSHAGAMSRLWAALNIFDELALNEYFCPDGEREWRTSLILPFNVNFDAVLYRCSKDSESSDPSDYKLLTMVNGFPVKIGHCDDSACKASTFLKKYEKVTETCDLDKICQLPANSNTKLEKNSVLDDD